MADFLNTTSSEALPLELRTEGDEDNERPVNSTFDSLSVSSGTRVTGETKDSCTSTTTDLIEGSTDATAILREVLGAVNTLSKTTEGSVQEFKDIAANLTRETQNFIDEMSNLHENLIRELKSLTHDDENRRNYRNINQNLEDNHSAFDLDPKENSQPYCDLDKFSSDKRKNILSVPVAESLQKEKCEPVLYFGDYHGKNPAESLLQTFVHNPSLRPLEVTSNEPQNWSRPPESVKVPVTKKKASDSTPPSSSITEQSRQRHHQTEKSEQSVVGGDVYDESEISSDSSKSEGSPEQKTKSSTSENVQQSEPPNSPKSEQLRSSRHRQYMPSATVLTTESGESGSQRLRDALNRAYAPELYPALRAKSYDTVLCLDTSDSMNERGAFDQMIEVAKDFINGIEDVTSEVEENIALVTFGASANIVQHLTNEFDRLRNAVDRIVVGGKSPFYEAMVVCLAAFHGKGGSVSVSGEYEVHPRIIFITDGYITESSDDPVDRVVDATNTRARFARLMMDLNPKSDPSKPHPIVFVPVGSQPDRVFLKSMSQLSGGLLIEAGMLTSLCSYFKVQETIGKVFVCMRNRHESQSEIEIEAVIQSLTPEITREEIREVVDGVSKELKTPAQKRRQTDPTDFNTVFEDIDRVAANDRLPLGTRVVRGPDWRWGNQDNREPGTVVHHEESRHPFTWVLWDNGNWNRYPYGKNMGYHVWRTDDHPVLKSPLGQLKIGMVVKKGPNWNNSEIKYDREPGVVIRESKDGRQVKVRWSNGDIQACPADAVEFSDPFEQDTVSPSQRQQFQSLGVHEVMRVQKEEEEEEADCEGKVPVWRWRDDWGNWRLYSTQENTTLEKAYQRKKTGSCVIQRGDRQFRILFRRRMEKDIQRVTERDVQRICLPEDELQSLKVAEELVSVD